MESHIIACVFIRDNYVFHCVFVVWHSTDPGSDRYKFSFTLRDSPADYINATCWGSQEYIKQLHSSFKISDVGKDKHVHVIIIINGVLILEQSGSTESDHSSYLLRAKSSRVALAHEVYMYLESQ